MRRCPAGGRSAPPAARSGASSRAPVPEAARAGPLLTPLRGSRDASPQCACCVHSLYTRPRSAACTGDGSGDAGGCSYSNGGIDGTADCHSIEVRTASRARSARPRDRLLAFPCSPPPVRRVQPTPRRGWLSLAPPTPARRPSRPGSPFVPSHSSVAHALLLRRAQASRARSALAPASWQPQPPPAPPPAPCRPPLWPSAARRRRDQKVGLGEVYCMHGKSRVKAFSECDITPRGRGNKAQAGGSTPPPLVIRVGSSFRTIDGKNRAGWRLPAAFAWRRAMLRVWAAG